jgi:predicted permease
MFRKDLRDRDLAEEIESHLQMHIDENLRSGMTPEEARRNALIKLGGVEATKEKYRERRGIPLLEHLFQDLRYALRMLVKNAGFTALAVLTLALGIGANTAIFSLVDVVLFRPLPIRNPGEVVRIAHGDKKNDGRAAFSSFPSYLQYRDHVDAFSGLAAYLDRFPVNLAAGKFGSERVDAGMVTGNYFQTLGVNAELGRSIVPEDDRPSAAPVVMLSHDYWRRHFPPDAPVLGLTAVVDGQPFTVVGVTPAGFGGVSFENLPEVWLPMSYGFQVDPLLRSQMPLGSESFSPFGVVGRLKQNVSLAQAQAQLEVVAERLGAGKPDAKEGADWTRPWPALVPAAEAARRHGSTFSFLVLGLVFLVLLIACADVAGLLLARSEARQKEVAIRLALGATRPRIIFMHLTEGLLISALGAGVGCMLANWATHLLVVLSPPNLPIPLERATSILDLRVLAFTALVAVLAGIVSSLAPAMKYSKSDLALAMKSESHGVSVLSRRASLRGLLVVVQVMASVLLLVGAGLLARTLWQASHIHLGFDPNHAVAASTDLVRQGYDKATAATLVQPLLDAVRSQPGVESAALGSLPLQGTHATVVQVEGHESAGEKGDWVELIRPSPGYFATLGIPILSGRDFEQSDSNNTSGVAIINSAMARKYWPDQSPIGKHIKHVGPQGAAFEIVGVVGDVAPGDLRKSPGSLVYLPLAQTYLMFPWQPDITILARTAGDPNALVASIKAGVARVNPSLPVFHVRTLQEQVSTTLAEERFLARLLFVFALLATVLSTTGVYGLVSYTTQRATHEFGIRMALGAPQRQVLWMVFRQGILVTLIGVAAGLGAALALTRLLMRLLYGVAPNDPITFAGVALLMALVTLLACYLPARRAMRVDPLVALRYE